MGKNEADRSAHVVFEVTEADLRRALEGAISLWCDDEDVPPLTREHLTEEIVRRLHELKGASYSGLMKGR